MSAKRLNSAPLPSITGFDGQRAEIAEAEDGRAVGDDGDEVALVGVVVGERLVLGDGLHRHGDARRIGERQVALRRQRLGRRDLELAGLALRVELQRFLGGEARLRGFASFLALSCGGLSDCNGAQHRLVKTPEQSVVARATGR